VIEHEDGKPDIGYPLVSFGFNTFSVRPINYYREALSYNMAGSGRRSHYRKHLTDAVLHDLPEPDETIGQRIARIVGSRGYDKFFFFFMFMCCYDVKGYIY